MFAHISLEEMYPDTFPTKVSSISKLIQNTPEEAVIDPSEESAADKIPSGNTNKNHIYILLGFVILWIGMSHFG